MFDVAVYRRYNDNPHGVFGVVTEQQTVLVDPLTNQRMLQLNVTRNAGSFGGVQVYYSIRYDKVRKTLDLHKCLVSTFLKIL